MSFLKFTTEQENGCVLVRMSGRMLGGPDAEQLLTFIRERLDEGCRIFLINAEKVEYFSGIGLAMFGAALVDIRTSGGTALLCCQADVEMIILQAGVCTVYPSEAAARAALAGSASRPQTDIARSWVSTSEEHE